MQHAHEEQAQLSTDCTDLPLEEAALMMRGTSCFRGDSFSHNYSGSHLMHCASFPQGRPLPAAPPLGFTCRERQEGLSLHKLPICIQEVLRVELVRLLPNRFILQHRGQVSDDCRPLIHPREGTGYIRVVTPEQASPSAFNIPSQALAIVGRFRGRHRTQLRYLIV